MDATYRSRAIVCVVCELALADEFVVNEGGYRGSHVGDHASATDLEANERAHRRCDLIEQEAGVAADEVDAARLLVVMANIGFNRHTGNDKRGWQRIVVCAACREGPPVDACPTGNWRQARHRAVLNHQVEILGESANEAECF